MTHHEQRLTPRARVEQGDHRTPDRGGGLLHGDRRSQGRARQPDRALTAQGAAVRGRHVPQPREHQQVQQGGEHRDHAVVVVPVAGLLDEQDGRGDQRREHEHGQPDGRCLGLLPRHRPGQLGHAGMEGRGAPRAVEDRPAEIDDGAAAKRPVQLEQAERHIGRQHPDGAEGQQVDGPGPPRPGDEEPGDHRQHEHVAERIGNRDALLDPGQLGVVHVGKDQVDPRQQGEPGGQGQGIDQAAPVPVRGAPPDEDQQPGGVERIRHQVQQVREGRKRDLRRQDLRQHEEAHLTGGEAQVRAGQQQPRRLAGRAVDDDARHDGQPLRSGRSGPTPRRAGRAARSTPR